MLQTLNIQNVALIERATLNFDERLNVISGETGAGKSILLDSLSFVFGGRADKSLIRSGERSMKVEAIFSGIQPYQVEFISQTFGIDVEDELFISRELDVNGKNTCIGLNIAVKENLHHDVAEFFFHMLFIISI